jgi:3-oxoacyl-[acyl-carrier-protein] synthase III
MNMAFIAATSRYLPPHVVENCDLIQFPPELRELIAVKAGIHRRHIALEECTSDLGAKAVQSLLEGSGTSPSQIDALICATSSPDRMQPATATRIADICGLKNAFAFDINSVCSGGVFALRVASGLVKDGLKQVIVVAAEVYSKILDQSDISTAPYFGDGAAACLVSSTGLYELRDFIMHSDGSGCDVIQVRGGGTMNPAAHVTDSRDFYFSMLGKKVFAFAITRGAEVVEQLAFRNGMEPDCMILHQANVNIIRGIAERTNLPLHKFFVNLDHCGNTAGASVLIALDEYLRTVAKADTILLCAFGGGLSWGGALLRRSDRHNFSCKLPER